MIWSYKYKIKIMFSVQDYFNDASQLIPEEKIVKIDKNAEYQLNTSSMYNWIWSYSCSKEEEKNYYFLFDVFYIKVTWSSVDRLKFSLGLAMGLREYADNREYAAADENLYRCGLSRYRG